MTEHERLVERVARAMCQGQGYQWDGKRTSWNNVAPETCVDDIPGKTFYREAARAALAEVYAALREPTEGMHDGLARDLIMWHDMGTKTPRALFHHLEMLRRPIPDWLRNEPEMQALDHVPSKATRAVLIHRAMTEASPLNPEN
jgi:hypothetical protein